MADDYDYGPEESDEIAAESEPKSSKSWLKSIRDAEKAFDTYQSKADNIDKLYASLERQANMGRDREFAMFWANVQVLAPSIYSRPPVPVVVPRFKDRKPVPRLASEMLERSCVVAFEMEDIDQIMRAVRDDLSIQARGVAWVRYETKDGKRKVCIEHKHRKDFLHDPARDWKEVGWVAGAAYLSRKEMRKRFKKSSGDAYQDAEFAVLKDQKEKGAADSREKAKVWEIWSKSENKVVWVTEGVDVVLDEDEPHLKLEGFFPCPKPAYATVQRGSLVPVPDFLFYKDQLEEINELTARISALAEALKVRGFYPAGQSEIGDAIEAAINSVDNRKILVPISNFAAFGSGGTGGKVIEWMPIDMVATTIVSLVELRRQLIDDVYQITGLSDIMRGATDPNETLGAQELKSQYGNIRVRDRQNELVRVARDITRIMAEIMAENFDADTLLEMSQMDIPRDARIAKQVKDIEAKAKKVASDLQAAQKDPETQQLAQQNPEQAEQVFKQAQGQLQALQKQIEELNEQPTVEKVMELLREQRLRPYVLEIETDSTIQPDENAEKQARNEFMQTLAGVIQQFAPMLQMAPEMAPMFGEMVKFAMGPYRVGRELEGVIDEAIEKMVEKAKNPQPNPEAEAAKAEAQAKQTEMQMKMQQAKLDMEREQAAAQREQQKAQLEASIKLSEFEAQNQSREQEMVSSAQKHGQEMEKGSLEIEKTRLEIEKMRQQAALDAQKAEREAESAEQDAEIKSEQAEQSADLAERSQALKERTNGSADRSGN